MSYNSNCLLCEKILNEVYTAEEKMRGSTGRAEALTQDADASFIGFPEKAAYMMQQAQVHATLAQRYAIELQGLYTKREYHVRDMH